MTFPFFIRKNRTFFKKKKNNPNGGGENNLRPEGRKPKSSPIQKYCQK